MGVYSRGRPRRFDPSNEKSSRLEPVSGEYRIVDKETHKVEYVGLTNDLNRRLKEHVKTGKLKNDGTQYVDYLVVNRGSSYDDMRMHEQRSIKKHNPTLNKSSGGEGRPTNRIVGYENEVMATPDTPQRKNGIRRVLLVGVIGICILILVFFVFGIGYFT